LRLKLDVRLVEAGIAARRSQAGPVACLVSHVLECGVRGCRPGESPRQLVPSGGPRFERAGGIPVFWRLLV